MAKYLRGLGALHHCMACEAQQSTAALPAKVLGMTQALGNGLHSRERALADGESDANSESASSATSTSSSYSGE